MCTSGCNHDHRGHTCTRTPSPTPVPTPDPTPDPTSPPAPPPPPPTPHPTALTCSGKHVSLYQHGDFHGWVAEFPAGDYPYHAFVGRGAQNDAASSIVVVDWNAGKPFQMSSGTCCWWLADNKPGHCPNCVAGNHYVAPWTCGTSRMCS